jgi:tetratricopeptide (TPR) repeat protein
MKANLWVFVSFLVIVAETTMAQDWTLKTKEQLLDEKYITGIYPYTYDEYAAIANNSKEYYFKANEYHDKKDYTNALKNYEIALSMFDWGAYYYQYGVCLMDMKDYRNAEKSFKKVINRIPHYDPYSIIAPYYRESGRNTIYTFDTNGIVRELYFSYYNLACIYSLTNNLEQSRDFLIKALEWGYPYISHILNDSDLHNLFIFNDGIKDEINAIYQAGFIDFVSGKNYEVRDVNDYSAYLFTDNKSVRLLVLSSDDRCRVLYGTYEVKNHHILIHYNKVTGYKGLNGFSLGGTMVYEDYEPYENKISLLEPIAIKNITFENNWEEKELATFNYFFKKPERRYDYYELKEKYNR